HIYILTLLLPPLLPPTSSPRFFSQAPAPPDLYTLSLHDALPISSPFQDAVRRTAARRASHLDRPQRSAAQPCHGHLPCARPAGPSRGQGNSARRSDRLLRQCSTRGPRAICRRGTLHRGHPAS